MCGKAWTDSEIELLKREYSHKPTEEIADKLGCKVKRVYNKAFDLDIKKTPEYRSLRAQLSNLKMKGNPGRFQKGHRPWNKGMKGISYGGRATRFQKGNRPSNYMPVGSERIVKGGFLQRKVSEPNKWVSVQRIVWEDHNGKIPPDHIVIFKNGNNRDFRIENLELISRAENMRRNSIHNLPAELASACKLKGKLNRIINSIEKQGKNEK